MKFHTPYDDDEMNKVRKNTELDFTGTPHLAKQEPAEDADINVLMKRFGVTDGSELPYFQNPKAIYGGDYSNIEMNPTLMHNAILQANQVFMTIPADIRQQFTGPDQLYDFLADPNNTEAAVKMGLLKEDTTSAVSSSTSSVKEPTSAAPAGPAQPAPTAAAPQGTT